MKIVKETEHMEIIYEPVWRITKRFGMWRFRRLWCVFDSDNMKVYYGKKKKYAVQKYEKALKDKK